MSLDFYLSANHCDSCNRADEAFSRNITHNLVPMWSAAGVYDALYMSDGKAAREIVTILRDGLCDMLARPEYYSQFNPSNRWGSYDSALRFLEAVVSACDEYPDARIGVSK